MLDHATQTPTSEEPLENIDEYLAVTVFSTQHCPGSVGFIFEGYFGKYIYVGDMRLEMSGESGESLLFQVEMNVRSLVPWRELEGADRLFMDTTFASLEWEQFPGRLDVLESILDLIESKSEKRQILLECDMLGTEQVLHAVHEHFNTLIYADPALYRKLEGVESNLKFLTTNRSETRFMVVPAGSLSQKNLDRKKNALDVDRHLAALDAFALKPSTQWFGSVARTKAVNFSPKLHDGVWHVPYSIHGSYSEIRRFVEKIKPKSISPLTTISRSDLDALRQLCQSSRRNSSNGSFGDSLDDAISTFNFTIPVRIAGAMKLAKVSVSNYSQDDSSDDDQLITHGREDLHNVLDDSSVDFSVNESIHEPSNGSLEQLEATNTIVDPKNWTPNSKPAVSLFGDVYSTDVSLSEDDVVITAVLPPNAAKAVAEDKLEKKRSLTEAAPLPDAKRKCESSSIVKTTQVPCIFDLMYDIQNDDL